MNRYGANVSVCRTPATMKNKSVSLSSEQIFVCLPYLWCYFIKSGSFPVFNQRNHFSRSSKVWWYRVEEMHFFLYVFYFDIVFMKYDVCQVWWNLIKSGGLIWFVLEITADSNSLQDFLQCMGLIRVAWEKLKVHLRSNMWEKRTFQSSFNWPFVFIDSFFSIVLGFADVMVVTIFAWNRVYACMRSGCIVGLFRDVNEIFNGLWYGLYNWYS